MDEWWTYSLEDFLLFSPRVYVRQFELQNAATWPLHVISLAVGLWLAKTVLKPEPNALRLAFLAVATAWLLLGFTFFPRYDTINWAAGYAIPWIFAECAVLAGLAIDPRPSAHHDALTRYAAGIILSYAVVLHPLVAWASGKPWQAGEVFGIAPDPTAFVTFAICLTAQGRWAVAASVPPLIWCLFSGATLRAMNDPGAWIPWGIAIVAMAVPIIRGLAARRLGTK